MLQEANQIRKVTFSFVPFPLKLSDGNSYRSPVPSTQLRALLGIIALATSTRRAQVLFKRHGAEEAISSVIKSLCMAYRSGSDSELSFDLLSSSRRALISLEENELSCAGKELLWPPESFCYSCARLTRGRRRISQWQIRCGLLLRYLRFMSRVSEQDTETMSDTNIAHDRHSELSFLALRYFNNCYTSIATVLYTIGQDSTNDMFNVIANNLIFVAHSLVQSSHPSWTGHSSSCNINMTLQQSSVERSELVHAIEMTLFFGSLASFEIKSPHHMSLLRLWEAYMDVHYLLEGVRLFEGSEASLTFNAPVF